MRDRLATILSALCLGLFSFGLFWHVAFFGAVNLDDPWCLVSNPQVNQGLGWENALHAFGPIQAAYWHPMATLSAMADFSLLGPYPGLHHLSSLFFHAMAVVLFFLALKKMTGALWPSALAALLFAVHPVNVEAVCWLAQRKTVLTGFFAAGTLLAYARYAQKPGLGRYLTVFAAMALCLMSKPSAIPLPLVLLLLDFWPLRRFDLGQDCGDGPRFATTSLSRLIGEKLPLLLLSAGTAAMTSLSGIRYGGLSIFQGNPLSLRLENALVSLAVYLGKFFYSPGPTVYVPFPASLPLWKTSGALLVLCLVAVWAARNFKNAPHKAVGLLWFLLCLAPVIGVVQGGIFPAWADRYAYLPFMGLYVATAWSLRSWTKTAPRLGKWIGVLALAWAAGLGLSAWSQSNYWANDRTLFSRALSLVPESVILRHNLAVALARDGFPRQAIPHYKKALALTPKNANPRYLANSHYNLGNAYLMENHLRLAEAEYQKALEAEPAFVQALNNLGLALKGQGRDREARARFNAALEIDPDFLEARNNLEDMDPGRETHSRETD